MHKRRKVIGLGTSIFTTGDIAKMCKVAPRTVTKWIDSGRLPGYRIPGSKDRRVKREQFIAFAAENGLTLKDLPGEHVSILIIGRDQPLNERLTQALSDEGDDFGFEIRTATDTFETARMLLSLRPPCGIVDCRNFESGVFFCRRIRDNLTLNRMYLVGIVSDENTEWWKQSKMLDEIFVWPFDPDLLKKRLQRLLRKNKESAEPVP